MLKDIKIGFTGTQRGWTYEQMVAVKKFLMQKQPFDLHHGDCIGADAEVDRLSYPMSHHTYVHPPINNYKRAYTKTFVDIREPKEYIARNHDIVDETDFLLATPGEKEEQLRSGTWATIRYARKKGKQVVIIYPDGEVHQDK